MSRLVLTEIESLEVQVASIATQVERLADIMADLLAHFTKEATGGVH